MLHLLRHAQILENDNVDLEQKISSADRMFAILATVVTDPDDREYVTKMGEEGQIELKDLLSFVTGTDEPEKPKARRGRPPKRLVS